MSNEPARTRPAAGTPGPLVVLSGPSGTGKSTVIRRLLASTDLPLRLSVSATTRPPRVGELDGREYHFLTTEQFQREIANDGFLEYAQVHGRHYYGTLKREVEPYQRQGIGVILDIDVQGADQVRRRCPDFVSIFLLAPSLQAYEERLRHRATETEEAIQRRLTSMVRELAVANRYDYQVVNDDLDQAVAELSGIVRQQFERASHAR